MTTADAAERPLDPRSIQAARVSGGIALLIVSGPTALGLGLYALLSPAPILARLGVVMTVVGLLGMVGAAIIVWPAIRYRYTRYWLDDTGLTIRRGVVWRSVTSIPRSRVQHTDVLRGPLQRHFDLATLVVHTAGTQDASVALAGLSHAEALAARDRLIEGGEGDGV